jgi:hypothetical protein
MRKRTRVWSRPEMQQRMQPEVLPALASAGAEALLLQRSGCTTPLPTCSAAINTIRTICIPKKSRHIHALRRRTQRLAGAEKTSWCFSMYVLKTLPAIRMLW